MGGLTYLYKGIWVETDIFALIFPLVVLNECWMKNMC